MGWSIAITRSDKTSTLMQILTVSESKHASRSHQMNSNLVLGAWIYGRKDICDGVTARLERAFDVMIMPLAQFRDSLMDPTHHEKLDLSGTMLIISIPRRKLVAVVQAATFLPHMRALPHIFKSQLLLAPRR